MTRSDAVSHTQDNQWRAASPQRSAWVSANAGSGKTHVLALRVVRLLLADISPSKILCLTFTRAAAANMAMRVYDMLARWTTLDDAQLRIEIARTGAPHPDSLDKARRLFARAIETPGGLKIQTIHAFCERLLHAFPFEANVAAGFTPMEDAQQQTLLAQAKDETLADALSQPQGDLARALRVVADATGEDGLDKLLREALGKRALIEAADALQSDGYRRALARRIGMAGEAATEAIDRAIVEDGLAPSEWESVALRLDRGSDNDKKTAGRLRVALQATASAQRAERYANVFLSEGKPRASMATKALDGDASLRPLLEAERARVAALWERRKGAACVERSSALVALASAIFERYRNAKRAGGLLDFDDLIERTQGLLSRASAAWVHYKLDAGIDHVLVDEAQDTSLRQWSIIRQLVSEFFVGLGARGGPRTLFVVGDEKQSIFSFQGAAPRAFGEQRLFFQNAVTAGGGDFAPIRLEMSFRSSPVVLEGVDTVFAIAEHRSGLSSDDVPTVHTAFKSSLPGLVEIWPAVGATQGEEGGDWRMPLDALEESDPPVIVARRIASAIKAMLSPSSRDLVHGAQGPRRVRAGDVMVLVRRRDGLFESLIRALKEADVPVAGADRLKLTEHIAVMDLMAAGQVALLPEDDFALACVLKSPLFGLDDDDLMALAPGRKGSLRAALAQSGDARHRAAAQRLDGWRALALNNGPFAFYATLLGAEGGRRQFLARLGGEAGDALDEFLRLALDHEREAPPSLAAFLATLDGAEIEIKRDLEAAGDAVRVMTAHAAKGLEAKIVFLPDTCAVPAATHDPSIVALEGGSHEPALPAWRRVDKIDPAAVIEARKQARTEAEEEYRRLLYVAMTRAEERLYIAGHHGKKAPDGKSWLRMIETALQPLAQPAPAFWDASETVLRLGAPFQGEAAAASDVDARAAEPAWLRTPARPEQAPAPPIAPSDALAGADRDDAFGAPGAQADEDAAASVSESGSGPEPGPGTGPGPAVDRRAEGELMHALLQYLPRTAPAERAAAARRFLAVRASGLAPARAQDLARRALALFDDPATALLFAAQGRAEAAVAGRLRRADGAEFPVLGRLDRIVVTESEALIVDFKTGAPRPAAQTPARYVAQLGIYRAALAPLFGGKPVRAFIVWTDGPQAVELPAAMLDAAVERALSGAGPGVSAATQS